MPENNQDKPKPSGNESTNTYHRKTSIEKYIADPIRQISVEIERRANQIVAAQHARNECHRDQEKSAHERYREQICQQQRLVAWQKWGVVAASILALLTIAVLIGNLCVLDRQRQISARMLSDDEAEKRAQLSIDNMKAVPVDLANGQRTVAGSESRELKLSYSIRNVGSTIAKEIGAFAVGQLLTNSGMQPKYDTGPSAGEMSLYNSAAPNPNGGNIVAGASRSVEQDVLTYQWFIDAMDNGTAYGHITIVVGYFDIYGQKQPVVDSLCYMPQFKEFQRCQQGHKNN